MRLALEKFVELYKTSPVFQDLVETAMMTGMVTGGQAATTDMTPEELALAASVSFGTGMVGRPIMGKAGQMVGNVIDKRYPSIGREMMESVDMMVDNMGPLGELTKAKLAPYRHLGGASQYANLLGRGYGDNIAQFGVGLVAPGLITGQREEEPVIQ